jgi:hypothetical protein
MSRVRDMGHSTPLDISLKTVLGGFVIYMYLYRKDVDGEPEEVSFSR